MKSLLTLFAIAIAIAIAIAASAVSAQAQTKSLPGGVTRVPVTFSGGYETEGRDGGRPIILIAAALGVEPDVFREAFSNVRPAHTDSGPTHEEARKNKAALMSVLRKHGISNDRLDEVSNYYRYVKSRGELWTHRPATANALVKNGEVMGYEITDAGAGYSSPPYVKLPDGKNSDAVVELSYGKDLKKNGSISTIKNSKELKN